MLVLIVAVVFFVIITFFFFILVLLSIEPTTAATSPTDGEALLIELTWSLYMMFFLFKQVVFITSFIYCYYFFESPLLNEANKLHSAHHAKPTTKLMAK